MVLFTLTYDFAVKPAAVWAGDLILKAGTFGLQSLRDELYQEIANMPRESAATFLLFFLLGIIITSGVLAWFKLRDNVLKLAKSGEELRRKVQRRLKGESPDPEKPPSLEELARLTDASSHSLKRLYRATHLLLTVVVLTSLALIYGASRVTYVSRAVSYYERIEALAAPHIDELERKQLRARFAQITSRQDYVSLVEHIRLIVEKNGGRFPSFHVI